MSEAKALPVSVCKLEGVNWPSDYPFGKKCSGRSPKTSQLRFNWGSQPSRRVLQRLHTWYCRKGRIREELPLLKMLQNLKFGR